MRELLVKLTLDLVPETCFFSNLRSELPKKDWDRLRRAQYKQAGNVCEICGGKGARHAVECHELWSYDEDRGAQVLKGLIALCPACHEVKHMGLAESRGRREPALRHLMKVNGLTRREAVEYCAAEGAVWRQRSRHSWHLDLSWLRGRIEHDEKKIEEARRARMALHESQRHGDFEEELARSEDVFGPTPEGWVRLAFEYGTCGHVQVIQIPDPDLLEEGQAQILMARIASDAEGSCAVCEDPSGPQGEGGAEPTPRPPQGLSGEPGPPGWPQGPTKQKRLPGRPAGGQGEAQRAHHYRPRGPSL